MFSGDYTPGLVLESLSQKKKKTFQNEALKSLFSPSDDHREKSLKKRPSSEENIASPVKKKVKKTKQDTVVVSECSVQKKKLSQNVKLESKTDQEVSPSKKKKKRKNIESTNLDEGLKKALPKDEVSEDEISSKLQSPKKEKVTELENDPEAENVPSKRRKKQKDISVVLDREKSLKDADDPGKKKKKKKKKTGTGDSLDRTVFVGNLPVHYTKKEIKELFKKYGEIETVRLRSAAPADPSLPKKVVVIKKELHPERHNINAYVVFINREDALKALKRNGKEVGGFHIRVDLAANSKKHDYRQTVFVGNLPFDSEEEPIRKHFSVCGKIINIRVIRDSRTGLGKGFCYIHFEDPDGAAVALQLNGKEFSGRQLRISRCVKKEKKKQASDMSDKVNQRKQKLKKTPTKSNTANKPVRFLQPSNAKSGSFVKKNMPKKKKKKSKGWTPTVSKDGKEVPRNQPNFVKARFRLQKKQAKMSKNRK